MYISLTLRGVLGLMAVIVSAKRAPKDVGGTNYIILFELYNIT
jgi:hypothetical protein